MLVIIVQKFAIMENAKNTVNVQIQKLVIKQQKNVNLNVENVHQYFRDVEILEMVKCLHVCEYLHIIYGNVVLGIYIFLYFMDNCIIILFLWNG